MATVWAFGDMILVVSNVAIGWLQKPWKWFMRHFWEIQCVLISHYSHPFLASCWCLLHCYLACAGCGKSLLAKKGKCDSYADTNTTFSSVSVLLSHACLHIICHINLAPDSGAFRVLNLFDHHNSMWNCNFCVLWFYLFSYMPNVLLPGGHPPLDQFVLQCPPLSSNVLPVSSSK